MTTRFDIHISIDWTACKASQSDVFLRLRLAGYTAITIQSSFRRRWSRCALGVGTDSRAKPWWTGNSLGGCSISLVKIDLLGEAL
jgi:hypothetical protein